MISKQHNIVLIEDSAQGFPVNNALSYWQGDFIIISFGRGKPVNLLGGGAVLTHNKHQLASLPQPIANTTSFKDNLKYKLKLFLYNQTIQPIPYGLITKLPGLNIGQTVYKPLNEFASISSYTKLFLNSNLRAYQNRTTIQNEYSYIFETSGNTLIYDLPKELSHNRLHPLLRYPILIKDFSTKERLYEKLKPYGASLMYKEPLYKIDNVGAMVKQLNTNYPNATRFSQQLLTLPTHTGVNNKTIQSIRNILKNI